MSKPSRRMPVPQSSTSVVPSFVHNSTQEVLPPKIAVFGPGVGIEPRVPQKRRRIQYLIEVPPSPGIPLRAERNLMVSTAHFSVKHFASSDVFLLRARRTAMGQVYHPR